MTSEPNAIQVPHGGGEKTPIVAGENKSSRVAPIDRTAWIAATAYAIAERRGFAAGHDLDDWLEAERQVQFAIMGEGRTF